MKRNEYSNEELRKKRLLQQRQLGEELKAKESLQRRQLEEKLRIKELLLNCTRVLRKQQKEFNKPTPKPEDLKTEKLRVVEARDT